MTNIDGAEVLNETAEFIGRFVAFPSDHCLPVVALWAAHTHVATSFYVTPRLVLDSAEPGSGKTRVLEVLALLCRRPKLTISATTAAIYRLIAEAPITLLFDEVDAIFNPKASGNYEDLRALLNSGYKRGATVDRCVGDAKSMKVQEFQVYSPVALAGIAGNMPTTITTRSVTIHMRRRAPGEYVEPFRERYAAPQAEALREPLAAWCESVAAELFLAEPVMPKGVVDRPAEVWEALLAIADAAGGEWPDKARAACRFFVLNASTETASLGQQLLGDIRQVFEDRDRMSTAALLDALIKLEESRWADMWGKPLDSVRLAKELKRYGIASKSIKMPDGSVARGYRADGEDGLFDAWRRYLPQGATDATDATEQLGLYSDAATDVLPSRYR